MKKKQKNPAFRKKVPKHVRAGKIAEQAKRDARRNGYRKTVSGIFCGTRRGFGFVTPDDGSEDVFIPAGDTLNALQGDRVEIAFRRAEGEKTEGRVTALLEKNNAPVTGTVVSERQRGSRRREKNYFLYPDSTRYPERIPLPDYEGKEGEKVQVLPVRAGRLLYGEVLRTFGDSQSREANCAAILISCGIEQEFEKEALSLAEETAKQPLSAAGRAVYDAPVLTIDGADAKDLDDAVSLTKTETGYLLSVHIADVSHYVPPKSALERAAFSRGTSVYFADRVVPMLPPVLSNGACSLNAGEDKYVLSAVLSLDCAGNLLSCRIEEGILCTDVRGVYTEVNDLFARGENSPHYEKYRKVYPMLREMETLYEKLYAAAVKRGFWEPDAPEPCFLTDETGFPVEIVKKERGIAERMIEQFMLLANQGVAELLTQKGIPCVYRVHNAPDPQKIQAL
ncbi:MAG: ribonuclease R, partial [Clostridia bacterium]|nr:ribonuclease R [Clostridia bacterium]